MKIPFRLKPLGWLTVIALLLSIISGTHLLVGSPKDCLVISYENAKNIARSHIEITLQSNYDAPLWKDHVLFKKTNTIYTLNDAPSLYLFELSSSNNVNAGYIVVKATRDNDPIVEFAPSGLPSFYATIEQIAANLNMSNKQNILTQNVKLYTYNNISYIAKLILSDNKFKYYELGSNPQVFDFESAKKSYSHSLNTTNVETQTPSNPLNWLRDLLSPPNLSTAIIGQAFVEHPEYLESNYQRKTENNVLQYDNAYFTTADFTKVNNKIYESHCSPLAATNLMYYWFCLDKTKYKHLQFDESWNNTFVKFYTLMNTSSTDGTYRKDIEHAYDNYFKNSGISNFYTKHVYLYQDSGVIDEINNGYPVHISVNNHYNYGNHSVIAVGYIQYQYNRALIGTRTSTYFRIIDGFSSAPNRFINSSTDGDWDYFIVRPT